MKPFAEAAAAPPPRRGPGGRLRACIIGGGGTGAALAYDLALRGLSVVLLEKGELTSGTTGRHHGQLHCGARYAMGDRAIARECMEESLALRELAPEAVEYNGGLFVALDEGEAARAPEFIGACRDAGIPAREIPASLARDLEPALSPRVLRAVWVPDGSLDAYRVPMCFFAAARVLGADIRPWTEVVGFERSGGRLAAAVALDRSAGRVREARIEADCFLSAAGAWAGMVAELAGVEVPVAPAPGTMLAVEGRLADRVISRLRDPGDGDILVPQRALTIIGSTQRAATDPEGLRPPPEDLAFLREAGAAMAPAFADAPFRAAWCAARPLAGQSLVGTAKREAQAPGAPGGAGYPRGAGVPAPENLGRSLSRDFAVVDHGARDGLAGFYSLVGGKATVLRAMAEKAADLACASLGVEEPCRTREYALPSWRAFHAGRRR